MSSTWDPTIDPTYGIANGITAGLALSGELFVLITYFRYKKFLDSPQMRLVLSLICTDMLETTTNFGFYFTGSNQTTCIINGFLREFGIVSSVFWVLGISHYARWFVTGDIYQEPRYRNYLIMSLSAGIIRYYVLVYCLFSLKSI